ncbi:endonuclease/exonuclease/phosphatase family protein [Candidatus Methylomirabilis sp.]|uniref:endonuclease/exonuclease/phosphatase family protein n=1 Tax=Candidatus Methylomirabilis sp. TaxID=2032687 RepID=UPI003076156F
MRYKRRLLAAATLLLNVVAVGCGVTFSQPATEVLTDIENSQRIPTHQPSAGKLVVTGDSLRILTYNTYLLPRLVLCTWDPICHLLDANFESRAEQLGAAVAEASEKYDIVAFNEVWDEDTRDVLEKKLGGTYPNYVKYISTSGLDMIRLKKNWGFLGGNFEDSGLMLFSKLPFRKLPFVKDDYEATDFKPWWIHKGLAFKEFDDCAFAFADCRAAKGVALIQVEWPSKGSLNVLFTHLQADSGDSMRPEVRQKQLADMQDIVETTLGKTFASWTDTERLVALGDLNIDGLGGVSRVLGLPADVLADATQEWVDRFKAPAQAGVTPLYDSWAETTSPQDQGHTRYNKNERLDYILVSRPIANAAAGQTLNHNNGEIPRVGTDLPVTCVQHIWIPRELEGLSNHRPVAADINLFAPQCNPRLAQEVDGADLGTIVQGLRRTSWQHYELKHRGSMQWFRLEAPGTYAIAITGINAADTPLLHYEIYSPDNLSVPLAGAYQLEKTKIAVCGTGVPVQDTIALHGAMGEARCSLVDAQKFVLPTGPHYVRVFSKQRTWQGRYAVAFYKFNCAAKDDACDLLPNSPQEFAFLSGRPLNAEDAAWFRVRVQDQADSGKAQSLKFFSRSLSGARATPMIAFVQDDGITPLTDLGGNPLSGPLTQDNGAIYSSRTHQNQTLYLRIKRPVANLQGHSLAVGWRTNLTLFGGSTVGPGIPVLICKDETNGFLGNEYSADEIHMEVNVDGQGWTRIPASGYVEFDCNDWKDSKVWDRQLGVIGFLESVKIRMVEQDDWGDDDTSPPVSLEVWNMGMDMDQIPDNWKIADRQTRLQWEWAGGEYYLRKFNMNRWRIN